MARRTPRPVSRRHPHAAPWRWALAGALLGLVSVLLLQAPARWLALALHSVTAGRVILVETRGTVWTGSTRLMLAGGVGSRDPAALPGRVDWRLRPAWPGLAIRLDAACCTRAPVSLLLAPRWGGASLQVVDAPSGVPQPSVWPADLLAGLGAPWNTLRFEGDLRLVTHGLSVEWIEGRPSLAGNAELVAARLSSRLSTLKPLGSYRIILNGGTTATLEVTTLEGSLLLTGSGRWVGSRLRFQGEASAAPERVDALSNLLNIIGRRTGARSIISAG